MICVSLHGIATLGSSSAATTWWSPAPGPVGLAAIQVAGRRRQQDHPGHLNSKAHHPKAYGATTSSTPRSEIWPERSKKILGKPRWEPRGLECGQHEPPGQHLLLRQARRQILVIGTIRSHEQPGPPAPSPSLSRICSSPSHLHRGRCQIYLDMVASGKPTSRMVTGVVSLDQCGEGL